MKTIAYWLTICAVALAIAALWMYNAEKVSASPVCSHETPCRVV